jgi:hypothetical protein
MATITKGQTFASGDVVTATKLNNLVDAATITGIVNADVDAAAAIAGSKLADGGITNAKFATSVGLNAWTTKTTTYTAVAGDRINADTSSAAWTLTLPATPATYAEVTLADHAGTWDTNNLTVARNSSNINGGAADLTCDSEGKQIVLRYEGATIGWRIYT